MMCKDNSCLCPVRGIIDVVSKKWVICIISILDNSSAVRFNELKRMLGNISPKSLSDTLKIMVDHGLITRHICEGTPPSVKYTLTDSGYELKKALFPLLKWVNEHEKNRS